MLHSRKRCRDTFHQTRLFPAPFSLALHIPRDGESCSPAVLVTPTGRCRENDSSFVHGEEGVVEKINHGKLVINILIYLLCPHPLFNHYSVQVMEGVQKC